MQFMYELVEKSLKECKISKIQFCHDTNAYYNGGQVPRQKFKTIISKDEAFYYYMLMTERLCLIQEAKLS